MLESALWDEFGSWDMGTMGRMLHWLFAGVLLLAAGFVHATAYIYDGRAQPNCTYAAQAYTCTSLPLSQWNDSVEIASGYRVNLSEAAVFGYNQGLKMSGTARLTSYRDIDISSIAPSLLRVTGGSFLSDRTIYMGAQSQHISASLKADHLVLGTGSTGSVTGTLEASRSITIGSHMTINGNMTAATVTTGSPVTIKGSVTASTSFSLSSGSSMTGNVNSPDVKLLASSIELTGNITSTGNVTIASGNRVYGDVTADLLTLDSSNARVEGDATVRHVVLGHHTRVRDSIFCTGGNTAGQCACVTNNSGYPAKSANAPNCPAVSGGGGGGVNHIRISHPVTGPTCMPQTVTVTACADSACTNKYTGGTSVTLLPGGVKFDIGPSGTNTDATVSQSTAGMATISLSGSAPSLVCSGTGVTPASSDCKIAFQDSALVVKTYHHVAESTSEIELSAVKSAGKSDTCAPAFKGEKTVTFKCDYSNPGSGSRAVRINGAALNASNNPALACDAAGRSQAITFDSAGQATASLKYADVGQVGVSASIASPSMSGSDSFIAVPASFAFSGITSGTRITAGANFNATITARNAAGATTSNFGMESSPETVILTHTRCAPTSTGSSDGSLTVTPFPHKPPATAIAFAAGVASATLSWSEVGLIDLVATLKSADYLGSTLTASGHTGGAIACDTGGKVGPFIPDHFDVTIAQTDGFDYSGQPITINAVTAQNKANETTVNYRDSFAKAVTLSAVDTAGNPVSHGVLKPATGTGTAVTIAAASFASGVGTQSAIFTFNNPLTAPQQIKVRATEPDVSSATGTENTAQIRSGRLRLFSAFGRAGANLSVPVRAEFWSGNSWALNGLHDGTIDGSAVALLLGDQMAGTRVVGNITLDKGQGNVVLQPPAYTREAGVGVVDLAVNLGSGSKDGSCVEKLSASTGAAMPWLRSRNGTCSTKYDRDPATRATFGGSTPEARRVIHVREVFR